MIEHMIGSAVGELLAGMEKVLEALDPESLSGPESLELFNAFHRIERLGAAGKALCARQMAATQAWYSGGHRSPCHLMAEVTGSSVRHAVDLLDAAEAMKSLPATDAKFRSGALTERQVIEVASAAVADPASEDELLERAEFDSFVELQQAAARVRAAATDDEERQRRAHRRRHFRHWVDAEGCFRFSGSLTAEAGAVLMAGIEPHRQALSRQAAESDKGRRRRRDSDAAVAADALVEMARCASSQPGDPLRPTPSAVVHVRVDHAALERGHTERGEVCEVPGVGPVTVGWVQSLLPDAVVAALLVEDDEVLRVAHLGRFIPAKVRTALLERDRCCVVPGCSVDCDLEIDHIRPIAAGGRSELVNLCRLCRFHHYLKTHHGWRISRAGKRWLWEGPHGPPPNPNAPQPELAAAGG
jgi:hypothetical protein